MDDVENVENVEDEAVGEEEEYEYLEDFTSQLKNLATSAIRQAYCCSTVLIFPAFSMLFDLTWTYWSDVLHKWTDIESLTITHFQAVIALSTCGLIVGAILLHYIGRKLTVIVANLLEMVFFLYVYLKGIEPITPTPSSVTMMHYFITGVGFITFFIYLAEIASPTFRPFFMGLYWLAVIIGNDQFKAFIVTKKLSNLFRNCSIVATFSLLLSLFIRETPFWLTLNGNAEKAEETFLWLRAGDGDSSEFDQSLDTANNIMENSIQTFIFTSTFVLCMVFSFFLIMGTFDACLLMWELLYEHYSLEYKWLTFQQHKDSWPTVYEHKDHVFSHQVYGQLIFLLFNFLVPRKVLYFVSYLFNFLVVLPWVLKIESVPTLMSLAPFCDVAPYIGITSLNQILPVEIYPIALREIGVVFVGSLLQLRTCLDKVYLITHLRSYSSSGAHIKYRTYRFISLYISFIGIPFILIFMPETKDTNIYELEELKLKPQPIFRGSVEESEDPVARDESSADTDASD